MSTAQLVLAIVGGSLVFTAVLLLLIWKLVHSAIAQARAAVEQEGIVLEAGPQWMTIRYAGFRARGLYRGVGITRTRATLVLTRTGRIVLLPTGNRYWLEPAHVAVGITDGALHIKSDHPSGEGASGSIDYRVAMTEPQPWVDALTKAGAQSL